MSAIHVRQIRSALEKAFSGLVDLSDVANRPEEERTAAFLTRALAAYSLVTLLDVSTQAASRSVTDGPQDNGIDAVFFHEAERVLCIVQAKWHHEGTGTLARGDAQKYITGFKDLVNARFDRFNEKLSPHIPTIESALDDARTRIILLVAYTGQEPLARDVDRDFQDLLGEINDPAEVASLKVLRQLNLYNAVAQGFAGAPIDIEVALYDWGQVREPFQAYYGQVSAADIATWWLEHFPRILAPNIRMFLGETEVNESLISTLASEPEKFWYFNNGVTALCATISKKPIGGSSRDTGIFECRDLRIVNGAQTVGAVSAATAKRPELTASARVPIRLISLEHCPEGFASDVTRYNNTQNRIERRDFVALDIQQERIRNELQIEGIAYVYKSGDAIPAGQLGFDLVEASVARACAQEDVTLAVQAKREIGRLWDDIVRPPYKTLFNSSVSGPDLWKLVQILRKVDESLVALRKKRPLEGRARLLSYHGNRFIAHVLFNRLAGELPATNGPLPEDFIADIDAKVEAIFDEVLAFLDATYRDAYLGSLFKNLTRCKELKRLWM